MGKTGKLEHFEPNVWMNRNVCVRSSFISVNIYDPTIFIVSPFEIDIAYLPIKRFVGFFLEILSWHENDDQTTLLMNPC